MCVLRVKFTEEFECAVCCSGGAGDCNTLANQAAAEGEKKESKSLRQEGMSAARR